MENALVSLGLEINEELFPLQQDRVYLVGRGSADDANNCENFIELTDKQLDLKHCLLEVTKNEEVYVIDLNSDAGVYLNNQRLQALTKVAFRYNDILRLGDNIGKLSQNKADESNESSGFLDVYKNCTIVVTSSPECKQAQNEDYLKSRLSKDTNNSDKTAEISNEENGIDSNFVIPDTQFYKPNISKSSFEKSPNESVPGANAPNRMSPTFFDDTEDEFCVPDTQEIVAPCTTAINNASVDESLAGFGEDETIPLKEVSRRETNEQTCHDANASTPAVTIFESQFRICTQDYNEGTQDEANESQILSLATCNKTADVKATIEQETTNEMLPLNWSVQTDNEKNNPLRNDVVTPDLPDLDTITSEEKLVNDDNNAVNTNRLDGEGDTEDLQQTQIFPALNRIKKIAPPDLLIKTVEGQKNQMKEMSNRENIQSELETMQFQTVNSNHKEKDKFKVPNKGNPKALTNSFSAQDEEDDLLTQALLKPTSTPNKGSPPEATKAPDCCSSTLPSGVQPNPVQCFNKLITPPSSKIAKSKETPVTPFIALLSSVDSDMDLLQCTPQIINMHINMEAHNLNINLLKDKRNMMHNDTSEGDETQEEDAGNCVTLLKPKASKDFESLLKNVKMSPVKKRDASNNVAKADKTNRFKILACEPESSKVMKKTKTVKYSKDTKSATTDSTKKRKKETTKGVRIYIKRIDKNDFSLPSLNKSISNQKQVSTADDVMKSEEMANKPKRHSPSPITLTTTEDSSEDYVPTQKFTRQTRSRLLHKHSETTADATISAKQIKSGRKREITTNATNEKHFGKRAKRENDTSTSSTSSASFTSNNFKRLQVSTSMLEPDILKSLLKHSGDLWCIATNPINSQVLVMDKGVRTYKFLLAMAKGIPIVTSQWLKKVNEKQELIPFDEDFLSVAELEKSHKFSLLESLQNAGRRRKPLFHGYEFALTSNILPIPEEMQVIIECLGGRVHLNGPKAKVATLHLVSCVEDKKDWHKFRRLSKNVVIISTEAIMSAVMQQSLDALSKHLLN